MQPHVPGDLLAVRSAIWRLRGQTRYADCTELDLEPADPVGLGDSTAAVLLEPFDRPEPVARAASPVVVSRRAWMAALVDAIAGERRCDFLSAPVGAAIDILPYQLEPAIAMALLGVPRVLLADAVGLGKTIQAALVIAELAARRKLRRALVLTPSGLRDQWARELRDRFGLEATVADAAWLRAARVELPASINPWSVGNLIISSIDFIKRPDVVRPLSELFWDIVVIDEAHAASSDSQRRAAAHALARRARHVLLLTATPHSGDRSAFESLCRIGATSADEPIVLFRRSRTDVGFRISRRVHLLSVRRSDAERQLHLRLLAYIRRIWRERGREPGADARLAAIVLLKRCFSSTASLAESLEFRLAHLSDPASAFVAQLDLPLDEDTSASDGTPVMSLVPAGLDDELDERRELAALGTLARAAIATDSKMRVLARWLGRVSEPCIVFTEYRDSLAAIDRDLPADVSRAILHGGLDRAAREDAVRQFVGGTARVLLATDAGGEGLNLQAKCRLVINLELPWNPIRLEQRIGRVDRIGQQRTVHAVNLIASGTHEAHLLARLVQRLDCIRDTLGSVDAVLGPGGEMAVASAIAGSPGIDAPWSMTSPVAATESGMGVERVSLELESQRQSAHVVERRAVGGALARYRRRRTRKRGRSTGRRASLQVASVEARRLGGEFARPGALAVFRSSTVDESGRLFDDALLPLFTPFMLPHLRRRSDVVALATEWLSSFRANLDAVADRCASARLECARDMHAREIAAGAERAGSQMLISINDGLMIQGALFDRRPEREADRQPIEMEDARMKGDLSLADRPELRLILMVTP